MKNKLKIGIVFLILLVSISFASHTVLSYALVDDAIVLGIGCIGGAFFFGIGGSCVPYVPPQVGYDCDICQDKDPLGKCTEYKCRAIGQTCRFVPSLNDPTESGFCVDERGSAT